MFRNVSARLRAIDSRRLRRPFTKMRREYGVYGDGVVWDFYGTEDEWIAFQLALMAAEEMPDDEDDDWEGCDD